MQRFITFGTEIRDGKMKKKHNKSNLLSLNLDKHLSKFVLRLNYYLV